MTQRITIDHLRRLQARVNRTLGTPAEYRTPDGKIAVGHVLIDRAYGGYQWAQVCNDGGGERDMLSTGHGTARDAWDAMQNYLRGYDAARESQEEAMRRIKAHDASLNSRMISPSGDDYNTVMQIIGAFE